MPALPAVCLVLITLALWLNLVFLVIAMVQVRRTAEAVEVLAYRVGENVERVSRATHLLGDFAAGVRSGWLKTLGLALGAAGVLWSRRKEKAEAAASANGD